MRPIYQIFDRVHNVSDERGTWIEKLSAAQDNSE
jgi:hypothetical protein